MVFIRPTILRDGVAAADHHQRRSTTCCAISSCSVVTRRVKRDVAAWRTAAAVTAHRRPGEICRPDGGREGTGPRHESGGGTPPPPPTETQPLPEQTPPPKP